MTIWAVGNYKRGHGHQWVVAFSGISERDAIERMYRFIADTHSALTRFEDGPSAEDVLRRAVT